jgi:predicted DNA-binding protein
LANFTNHRQVRSTRVSISLPPELHERLLRLSEQQQRSLSNLCAVLLSAAMDQQAPLN